MRGGQKHVLWTTTFLLASLAYPLASSYADEPDNGSATAAAETAQEQSECPEPMCQFFKQIVTGVGQNAVRAPFARFLLVRDGQRALAIRIDEHTRLRTFEVGERTVHRLEGARYTAYFTDDVEAENVTFNMVEGEASETHGERVEEIKAGDWQLAWSQSDWIYFPSDNDDLQMAVSWWIRIEDVDFDHPHLYWITRTDLPDAPDGTDHNR